MSSWLCGVIERQRDPGRIQESLWEAPTRLVVVHQCILPKLPPSKKKTPHKTKEIFVHVVHIRNFSM